jgi:hypothetical protein
MSAHPGDSAADRRPFPPFGPAVSRPLDAGDAAPAAAAPLPPFAPFARPEPAPEALVPAAEEAATVVDEYAYAPAPGAEDAPVAPGGDAADEPWAVWDAAPEEAAPAAETQPADEQPTEEPWASWEAQPATDEAPAPAASFDAPAAAPADDLPWLTVADDEQAAVPITAEEPSSPPVEDEEMPAWMTWGGGDEAEASAPVAEEPFGAAAEPAAEEEPVVGEEAWSVEFATEEAVNEGAPAVDDAVAGMEDFYAGAENAAAEEALYAPSVEAEAEPASALPAGAAEALGEVADRLERIARALRERPQEVLAGGDGADPLELLVTGFALGYAQGRRGA